MTDPVLADDDEVDAPTIDDAVMDHASMDHTAMDEDTGGAMSILRRGLAQSPELRAGLIATLGMGAAVAIGRLIVPVLIERAINDGVMSDGGVDTGFVLRLCVIMITIVLAAGVLTWATQRRLVSRAELTIANLRIAAFNKVHALSVADHNDSSRGVLLARVTADADALARFAQWGLYSWSIQPMVIIGILGVLAYYSWPLAFVVTVIHLPVIPCMRWLQRRQLAAYDLLRNRIGEMLTSFSETVMGAAVLRAYGAEGKSKEKLRDRIQRRYQARIAAQKYMVGIFIVGDGFGALAFVSVLTVALWQRVAWNLDAGDIVACLFLVNMLQQPIAELGETMDQTQTAVSGWRKVLNLIDQPIDLIEPEQPVALPASGPLTVEVRHLDFAYRGGERVLNDVNVTIAGGSNVAIVGETGSGKTTFAKLLCRLADPTGGELLMNGVALHRVSEADRRERIRMVPQDGFLFDTTLGENVSYGRIGASTEEIVDAFDRLGLRWWLEGLPHGLETEVGERGQNLSVGERQLVALARAALANPGLLVLDEATSAIDPETDQALTAAIAKLAQGRTVVSIAHRLATAEAADVVLVFDQGRLVEQGHHLELVNAGGIYARLHAAWIGNTRTQPA